MRRAIRVKGIESETGHNRCNEDANAVQEDEIVAVVLIHVACWEEIHVDHCHIGVPDQKISD